MKPQIIFLDGTSSAGKTTIAKALQRLLQTPWLHVQLDAFEEMMPPREKFPTHLDWRRDWDNMIRGFHQSIANLAAGGSSIIVDHLVIETDESLDWRSDCLDRLAPFNVFFVAVRCPVEVSREREKLRPDRQEGLSEWQSSRMHLTMVYDFEVDTSVMSAEECAVAIISASGVH